MAVIRALTRVIERSTATTVMGLEKDLHSATVELKESYPTVISVSAASELFLRFVTRTSALDLSDFHALKQHLIDRGNQFAQISSAAKVSYGPPQASASESVSRKEQSRSLTRTFIFLVFDGALSLCACVCVCFNYKLACVTL